jgi:hypothetical protein
MASNKKLKYRAGDMLKAKFCSVDINKYILVLETTEGADELQKAYYVLDITAGEQYDTYRRSIEHYYTLDK